MELGSKVQVTHVAKRKTERIKKGDYAYAEKRFYENKPKAVSGVFVGYRFLYEWVEAYCMGAGADWQFDYSPKKVRYALVVFNARSNPKYVHLDCLKPA